jgi:hypothetical protein
MLLLFVLVSLSAAQAQTSSCDAIRTCGECGLFTDSSNPLSTSPCNWCVAGPLSVGCRAMCPPGSTAVVGGYHQCPVTFDVCPSIQSCGKCNQNSNCNWCGSNYNYNSNDYNGGCVSRVYTCPQDTTNQWSCPNSNSNYVAITLASVSMIVGLLIGAIGFWMGVRDPTKQQSISVGLFALSFVFWGASLFSFLLSCKVVKRASRECCNGYCFCIYFFGIFELCCVLAGFLSGVTMDATASYYYSAMPPGKFECRFVFVLTFLRFLDTFNRPSNSAWRNCLLWNSSCLCVFLCFQSQAQEQ